MEGCFRTEERGKIIAYAEGSAELDQGYNLGMRRGKSVVGDKNYILYPALIGLASNKLHQRTQPPGVRRVPSHFFGASKAEGLRHGW